MIRTIKMYSSKTKRCYTMQLLLIIGISVLGTFSMPHTTTGQEETVQSNDTQLSPYILVTTFSSIYRIHPWPYSSPKPMERLVFEENGGIEGIGYHYRMGHIFWTNIDSAVIRTARLDGTNITDLVSDELSYPADLSVDWINDKLYWTDRQRHRIEEYNLITGYRRTVVYTGAGSLPTGITVYPYPGYGWIYWTDVANQRIERVSVTGDGRETIVGTLGRGCIRPIALDYFAQVVHWIDNCDFSLRSATIIGNQINGNVRISRTGDQGSSLGLALYEDILYWSETANVYGVNKTTGIQVELVQAGTTSDPFKSLKVVHPNNQPNGMTYVEKILETIDVEDYNSSCPPCMNGQCIPPGLCACEQGWSDVYCNVDQNECEVFNGLCAHTCTNTNGSYFCSCEKGYQLGTEGRNCTDVDECALSNGGCQHNCTNLAGSYYCSCLDGYTLAQDGLQCGDNLTSTPTYSVSLPPTTAIGDSLTIYQSMHSTHTLSSTHTTDIRKTSSVLFTSQKSSSTTSNIMPTPSTSISHEVFTTTSYMEDSSLFSQSSMSEYTTVSSSQSTRKFVTLTETPTESQHPTLSTQDPVGSVQLVTVITGAVAGGICLIIVIAISIMVVVGCYTKFSKTGSYTLKHQVVRSDSKSPNSFTSRTSFGINGKVTPSNSQYSNGNT